MVPEDRHKRKARPDTDDLPFQPAPAEHARKAGRSTTPVRCIRPEAIRALAAVRAEEQRAAASSDQQLDDHLRAAALARGNAVAPTIPLALTNAYGPLQRPAEEEDEVSESMATTDADDGRGSDRSRGSRGSRRSGLTRRAKAMQRRTAAQAGATGNVVLARTGATATGSAPGTMLG